MNPSPELHAWIDESWHDTEDGGLYLLAATMLDPLLADDVRTLVRGLRITREPRLHWHTETPARRRAIARALAGIGALHTVVVGAPVDPVRQERARTLCLERLAVEMNTMQVTHVLIERRTTRLNARDTATFDRLRARGMLSGNVRMDFAPSSADPMLWVADAVAGAVGSSLIGADLVPLESLGGSVGVVRITLA